MERISAGIQVFGNSSPTWKSFNHVSKSAVTRWETEAPPWTQDLLGADQRPDPLYQTHKLSAIKLKWVFH